VLDFHLFGNVVGVDQIGACDGCHMCASADGGASMDDMNMCAFPDAIANALVG